MVHVAAYLKRISYQGAAQPTVDTLRGLHQAHLLAVPFENLDIHRSRLIVLDLTALFQKIVLRRRGGFCYELNGLFGALLSAMGFEVTLLSARVARDNGGFGPEFDHLVLLVTLEERWLADVGFGDLFRAPLRLDAPSAQPDDGRVYQLAQHGGVWTVMQRENDTEWKPQYTFTLRPRQLGDFAGMCHYHQTSPESAFTGRRICTRATPEGRITLSDLRLIVTEKGERRETLLADEAEYAAVLHAHFGIELAGEA